MGLPSKRRTKQQKRERASHFALVKVGLTTCSHCKKTIIPHRVCPFCGYYGGREVVKMDKYFKKRERQRKARGQAKPKEEKEEKKEKKDVEKKK
jgi:large subunit ribosomal protein L32